TVREVDRFNFTRAVVDRGDGRAIVAVGTDGAARELSFAEVSAHAARWTNALRRRGVSPGDRVLVLIGKTPEWHAVMCACLRPGAVAIPCPDMPRAKDLAFRVSHAGARLLVADRAAEAEVGAMDADVDVVYLDEARVEDEPDRAEAADTTAGDPA